jgi:hypothetical protein
VEFLRNPGRHEYLDDFCEDEPVKAKLDGKSNGMR